MKIVFNDKDGMTQAVKKTFSEELKIKSEEHKFDNLFDKIFSDSECLSFFNNETEIDKEVVFYLDKEKSILQSFHSKIITTD